MTLPIYDRYQRATGWKKVIAVEGRVFQVPEINELQSVAHDNVRQLGDVLFSDGSIVAGLQPVIGDGVCNITGGKLYAFGYVIDVDPGSVEILGTAEEKIGIKVTEVIETEVENEDLTDPVTGADNEGMPGAYRMTFDVEFTVDDPDAFTLHVLRFGELITNNVPPQFDQLNQTLALRTHEESGPYLVNGMNSRIGDTSSDYVSLFKDDQLDALALTVGLTRAEDETDADLVARIVEGSQTITVEAGTAYVEGFRVFKPSPTKLLIPKARTREFVNGEVQLLLDSHSSGDAYDITLYNGPIASISDVTAPIRKSVNVARHTTAAADFIGQAGPIIPPLVSVTYLTETYTLGVHFNFTGTSITWLDPDNVDPEIAPPRGATYQVVLNYNATLTVGTAGDPEDVYILNDTQIRLTGSLGGSPVQYHNGAGALMSLDYEWYLDRIDTIYLDKNGAIQRQAGQSARFPVAPVEPLGTLSLSQTSLKANTSAALSTLTNLDLTRFTMRDIRSLSDRLARAEYNQAVTNLNTQARLGVSDATLLKGIFTDNFSNFDKVDAADPDYLADPARLDTINGELTTTETSEEKFLQLDIDESTNIHTPAADDKKIIPSFTPILSSLFQTVASGAIKVNAYSSVIEAPSMTTFPNESSITITNGTVSVPNATTGGAAQTIPVGGIAGSNINSNQNSTAQNIVFQNLARYIAERSASTSGVGRPPVLISAQGFPALVDNLSLTMDGIALPVRPRSVPAGTTYGATLFGGSTGAGTVTVTTGNANVTGVGTSFQAEDVGKYILIAGQVRKIATRSSTTAITVDSNWTSAGAAVAYQIGGVPTVKAAADGTVTAEFDIPADTITSGRREVRLSNGTDTAITVFVGRDMINQPVFLEPQIITVPQVIRTDPVAQTFVFSDDIGGTTQVVGVRLFIKAKPSNSDAYKTLTVEIRETIAGLPVSTSVLARKMLRPADVPSDSVTTNASDYLDVILDQPVICQANKEYAVVLMTNYAEWEVFRARLGESTVNTTPIRLVDKNVAEGVLLTSANGRTWTPDQFADLTYGLLGATIPGTATARFDQTVFTNKITRLQLAAGQEQPTNAAIIWEYSADGFNTVMGTLDPNGKTFVELSTPEDTIDVRARMINTTKAGCAIGRSEIKLVGYGNSASGVYVTKTIFLEQAPTAVRLSLDLQLPVGTDVELFYALYDNSNVQQGGWVAVPTLGSPVTSGTPGFQTQTYEEDDITTAYTRIKFKVLLSGAEVSGDVVAVPKARRLIAVIT